NSDLVTDLETATTLEPFLRQINLNMALQLATVRLGQSRVKRELLLENESPGGRKRLGTHFFPATLFKEPEHKCRELARPAPTGRLHQLSQQFVVGLVLLQRGDERFHRFDRVQVHHGAAELADRLNVLRRKEFFLFARAALGNVDCREQAAVGMLAFENQFYVAGSFELI